MNKELKLNKFTASNKKIKHFYNNIYINKPSNIITEAIQWDGNDINSIVRFCGDAINIEIIIGLSDHEPDTYKLTLTTPYGNIYVPQKDYIIKIKNNEFIICQSEIFETFYERI